ncbi:MAG: ribokinase [Erysipelotrichaceae bacterium]|nr:ribokinase [Erysipelotrichaceae bacterium]
MSSVLVIGSSNVDLSATVTNLPKKGETLMGKSFSTSFGGKGANQAVACGKLGADVTFLSCVGNDDYGKNIIKYLSSVNVKTDLIKVSDNCPTGTALITIDDDGQNTIVVISGANAECDVEYLKANEEEFKKCEYVLLQMEIPLDAIEYAIECAHKYNKKIILNPAPADPNISVEALKKVDYLTPNETEVEIMAKTKGFKESCDALLELGINNLIVTLGDKGAAIINKETNEIVEGFKVEAIDTVGAGDCFNGAFVTALSKGKNEAEAIKFANKASSIAVTRKGAQEAIPTIEEMENM